MQCKHAMAIILGLFLLISGCSRLIHLDQFGGYRHKPHWVEQQLCPCDAQGQIEPCTKTLKEFDRRGRQISLQNFRKDGTPSGGKWTYAYDKQGNLTDLVIHDAQGKPQTINRYSYDSQGRKKTWTHTGFGKMSITEYTYDGSGNMTWVQSRYEDGTFKERTGFLYDDKNRKSAMLVYNVQDTLTTRVEFDYDAQGNLSESRWHSLSRNHLVVYRFQYNDQGDRTLHQTWEMDGDTLLLKSESKSAYQYDSWGNCIEDVQFKGLQPAWITKTRFVYW